jgi:hypothetical protein
MVAGEVVLEGADVCASGVKVTLVGDGESRETLTGTYGDFVFEPLLNGATYTLTVAHDGYAPVSCEVRTHTDVELGEVVLAKA